jgi:hypothetical protein
MAALTKTTRMTHTPDEGSFEKWIQDRWDEGRDKQVRTCVRCDTATAIRQYVGVFNDKLALFDKTQLSFYCGSYDLTDGEKTSSERDMDEFIRRIHSDEKLVFNKLLKRAGWSVLWKGVRKTGTIHFADGTMEVIDPTKGFLIDGARKFAGLRPIHTIYCVLVHKDFEKSAPKSKSNAPSTD